MLDSYREHVAERAALGIPPLPLSAQQTAELIELIKNPPAGEEAFLVDLLTHRVPAGVDDVLSGRNTYDTNWQEEVTRPGHVQDHILSMSGGTTTSSPPGTGGVTGGVPGGDGGRVTPAAWPREDALEERRLLREDAARRPLRLPRAHEAVARARRGEGPSLVEAKTYRFYNHHGIQTLGREG